MDHPWSDKKIIEHCRLLSDSYCFWTKNEIIDSALDDESLSFLMYHSSFVIVSHNTLPDPVFNYANMKAQELWKTDWDQFIKTPSRLSAEPIESNERQKLLSEAAKNGFISNYNGIRISSVGERFKIMDTILWNVIDGRGNYHGQAALFSKYEFL
ncbi:MAG: MEKHLA domain-containing protein [Cytophagaceae bacterium]|nr:MEKHLA domain-containing protein [Cytophagaceae bacterium]